MIRVVTSLALLALVTIVGCQSNSGPHPSKLTGRWVRLKRDSTWGDTMEFRSDGSMRGSMGYPVPPNLKWEVKRDEKAPPQFCATVTGEGGFCRPYTLSGDRLEMIGGPDGKTVFRRVR